jgi:hypothetical protein
MDPRVIYETWAPPDGLWSPWAKPVLFAHLRESSPLPPVQIPEVRLEWEPAGADRPALVLDLPGLESIGLALELLRLGYRPVPLFNACPDPGGIDSVSAVGATREVVSAMPLLLALIQGADRLKSATLASDAPPAFLLDANRLGIGRPIGPGVFDNRWVVFPTDFPSANYLAAQGIKSVRVVHRGALSQDLLDVLQIWRRQGIALSHINLDVSATPGLLTWSRNWLSGLSRLARRLWVLMSLRRNPRGGFGGLVPEASGG